MRVGARGRHSAVAYQHGMTRRPRTRAAGVASRPAQRGSTASCASGPIRRIELSASRFHARRRALRAFRVA